MQQPDAAPQIEVARVVGQVGIAGTLARQALHRFLDRKLARDGRRYLEENY